MVSSVRDLRDTRHTFLGDLGADLTYRSLSIGLRPRPRCEDVEGLVYGIKLPFLLLQMPMSRDKNGKEGKDNHLAGCEHALKSYTYRCHAQHRRPLMAENGGTDLGGDNYE